MAAPSMRLMTLNLVVSTMHLLVHCIVEMQGNDGKL